MKNETTKSEKSQKKEEKKTIDFSKIYQELIKAVENLPKEAIEKAKKEITRKGYDTTGYQYQFLVNVLNETIGMDNWDYDYELKKEIEGKWANGKSFWEITVEMKIEIYGKKRKCVGGHKAEMYSDAYKGAITNSFKKTLGFFGVGKKAYEGTIDEDYLPVPNETQNTAPKAPVVPIAPKISPLMELKAKLVEIGKANKREIKDERMALELLEVKTGVKPKKFADMTDDDISNSLDVLKNIPF